MLHHESTSDPEFRPRILDFLDVVLLPNHKILIRTCVSYVSYFWDFFKRMINKIFPFVMLLLLATGKFVTRRRHHFKVPWAALSTDVVHGKSFPEPIGILKRK